MDYWHPKDTSFHLVTGWCEPPPSCWDPLLIILGSGKLVIQAETELSWHVLLPSSLVPNLEKHKPPNTKKGSERVWLPCFNFFWEYLFWVVIYLTWCHLIPIDSCVKLYRLVVIRIQGKNREPSRKAKIPFHAILDSRIHISFQRSRFHTPYYQPVWQWPFAVVGPN